MVVSVPVAAVPRTFSLIISSVRLYGLFDSYTNYRVVRSRFGIDTVFFLF